MPRARRQDDPTRKQPLTIQALQEYGAFESFAEPGAANVTTVAPQPPRSTGASR